MLENYIYMIIEGVRLEPKDLLYLIPVFIFMITATCIDAKYMKIPNRLNYTMMLLRIMFIVYFPMNGSNILGFIIGGALIMIPAMVILKPMGGDIKFSAALGLWIGDISIFLTLIIAVLLFLFYGIIIKKMDRKKSMAFAPFMSIGYIGIVLIGLFIY